MELPNSQSMFSSFVNLTPSPSLLPKLLPSLLFALLLGQFLILPFLWLLDPLEWEVAAS